MQKKLIYVNDIPNQYIKHQEFIKNTINKFFDTLNIACQLKIKFIESISINEYECTDCTLKNISVKRYELMITDTVLKTIDCDGGTFFFVALYHEFEHIRDYSNMVQTKLFCFNLCLANQKNLARQYVTLGFRFWTEIYAYYQTLEFAKQNNLAYEKITFGNLVTCYAETVNRNKNLYYKKDLTSDEANKYINSVDSFIYLCAKYMAAVYASHSRVPYAKIEKNKNYKKVFSILNGFEPKVKRLLHDAYGLKAYDNLLRLGKYIGKNLRWRIFKVGLTKRKGRVVSFY